MSFLQSIFGLKPASFLGVDIGTSSIKIVEVSKALQKPQLKTYGILETYGHLERLNNAIQTSSLKILENETAELLKTLVAEMKVKTKDVVASLPQFLVFTTLLELPQMTSDDIGKSISFQARQYIPLPISEVSIDWLKVGEREDENGVKKQLVFLIGVPNENIKKYKAIFKSAGLTLRALELETLSLSRSLVGDGNGPVAMVDIGARSTIVSVIHKGLPQHIGQSDFAASSLTQAIANGLNINVRRAETLKKQRGLLGRGGDYELSTLVLPFLDAIIEEIRRGIKAFQEKNPETPVGSVILSGGGANLLGIEKYFSDQLGIPITKGNPFFRVGYPPEIEPLVSELSSTFSVAIGLGIRELV
ncbi:MAG: type IV pilus assembly protein PilM [Candidatus Brennerbacteria bacterium]|nr:type IV pilus assembly protein PilM [Candidatus Brennerbacteria bacterium]